jgi:CRISPR-associated exonuclease Cas4
MEELIPFTMLNDYIFCPASIYFHKMYDGVENLLFTGEKQITGKALHKRIDEDDWTQSDVICGRMFESAKYGIYGKIDKYYPKTKALVESKAKILNVYDGYVFQLYAQCFACREAGLIVDKLELYSIKDNKKYPISLPEDDPTMLNKFEALIEDIHSFNIETFEAANKAKCDNCIYSNACAWGI